MGIFGLKPKKEKILPPRCDYCGKFISYNDIHEGLATYKMISPDSELSVETFEGCCKKCRLKYKD
jgi:hypothetical protein